MNNNEILEKFLEWLKLKNYSPKSLDSFHYCLSKFFKHFDKSYQAITREDIFAYGAYLKDKNYSPYTIERSLASLKKFFAWCFDNFLILLNPAETLVMSKIHPKLPEVLTQAQAAKLLEQPDILTPLGTRDKALLETLYSAGIRLSEAVNLNIDDIDIASGFLRVNMGKGGKDRVLPLTRSACAGLKDYLNHVRPKFCRKNPDEPALFVGNLSGRRINPLVMTRIIRAYVKRAGISKRVTVHTIRHSLATHLLQNGVHIAQIQKLLGHSRLSVTQLYTHLDPKELKTGHINHHPRERGLKWKI